MSLHRAAARRGLLGGLLALVVFASVAVAMAARAPSDAGTLAMPAQTVIADEGDGEGGRGGACAGGGGDGGGGWRVRLPPWSGGCSSPGIARSRWCRSR